MSHASLEVHLTSQQHLPLGCFLPRKLLQTQGKLMALTGQHVWHQAYVAFHLRLRTCSTVPSTSLVSVVVLNSRHSFNMPMRSTHCMYQDQEMDSVTSAIQFATNSTITRFRWVWVHGLCGDRMLRAHRNFSDVDLRSRIPRPVKGAFLVSIKQYLMILARIYANEQAQSYF